MRRERSDAAKKWRNPAPTPKQENENPAAGASAQEKFLPEPLARQGAVALRANAMNRSGAEHSPGAAVNAPAYVSCTGTVLGLHWCWTDTTMLLHWYQTGTHLTRGWHYSRIGAEILKCSTVTARVPATPVLLWYPRVTVLGFVLQWYGTSTTLPHHSTPLVVHFARSANAALLQREPGTSPKPRGTISERDFGRRPLPTWRHPRTTPRRCRRVDSPTAPGGWPGGHPECLRPVCFSELRMY